MKIFITGGAGFIGSYLVKKLAHTHEVLVYDNLHKQVHGENPKVSFPSNVKLVIESITNKDALQTALTEFKPEIVYHLAAETGTGQSMDEITRYCEVNVQGTAILAEVIKRHIPSVKKVVLSSSRAVYGEGPWKDSDGSTVYPDLRNEESMRRGDFWPCLEGEKLLTPSSVNSRSQVRPISLYASTKLMQEYILQQTGGKHWKNVILRFQNVYGAGQSLRNPYTGVLSIFSQKLKNKECLNVFEDGEIVRDFVYVEDVVEALISCLHEDVPENNPINIGSGEACSLINVTKKLIKLFELSEKDHFKITGDFRAGDIRHALADITEAKDVLSWVPKVSIDEGLHRLVTWVNQEVS